MSTADSNASRARPRDEEDTIESIDDDDDRKPPAKRARQEEAPANDSDAGSGDEDDNDDSAVDYEWIDPGILNPQTGRNHHQAILLTVDGKTFPVRLGDAVRLHGDDDDNEAGWCCKVLDFWECSQGGVNFKGQWFVSKSEIVQYNGKWEGRMSKDELVESLLPGEQVLSEYRQENEIGTIACVVTTIFQRPGNCGPVDCPPNSFLCRYRLQTANKVWILSDWTDTAAFASRTQHTDEPTEANDTLDDVIGDDEEDDVADDDSASASSGDSSVQSDKVRIEGEGSNLRSDIQIGPKYQVPVGRFDPAAKYIAPRQPQLVWKANAVSDEDIYSFLRQLAPIHNEYLVKHGLTTLDGPAYSPLPADKAEALMRDNNYQKLFPSHMSTASTLSSRRNGLLKECNVDAILELFHDNGYSVDKAIDAVRGDLAKITNAWSKTEKRIFNDGFRREQGALRSIAKLLMPMRNYNDVIDYWFRFKVSDQFRLYQDKKREQAIRMMECIEKRRYHESSLKVSAPPLSMGGRQRNDSHWSDTSVAEVASATEDRRLDAKALLVDINQAIGSKGMAEVAAVLRVLHEKFDAKLKKHLFSLLIGQPELQQRLLEFLPKS